MKNLYEIDISHEFKFSDVLRSLDCWDITIEKYIRVGPGGGNQLFQFSASAEAWNDWCLENYSEDPESHKIGSANA